MAEKKYPWLDAFIERFWEDRRWRPYMMNLKKNHGRMSRVYEEIEECLDKLPPCPKIVPAYRTDAILMAIIGSAADHDPNIKKGESLREIQKELSSVELKIHENIQHLCQLLNRRDELQNKSTIHSTAHLFDVVDLIYSAAERDPQINFLFKFYIDPILAQMHRFEPGRYYPELINVIEEIGYQIKESQPIPGDPVTDTVLQCSQKNRIPQDFMRALYLLIKENKRVQHLPAEFKLTHDAIADITLSVFDLNEHCEISANTVTQALRSIKKEQDYIDY